MGRLNNLTIFSVFLIVAISFSSILIWRQSCIFDDSFITYRYAKNLAQGFGITWNRMEAPVEGYTTFLLVIILAPFIKAGMDPLLVTKALSVMSAIGIGVLCVLFAKRYFTENMSTAIITGLAFLPVGQTFSLSTLGMETVIYTFFLFLSFFCIAVFFDTKSPKALVAYGIVQFLSFLLRPEGSILAFVAIPWIILQRERVGMGIRTVFNLLAVSLALPVALYLAWKWFHFGSILPNPYYLKADIGALYSPIGLKSIIVYYKLEAMLLIIALFSLALRKKAIELRLLSFIFVCAYTLFFLRIDTLMDAFGRFLYPVTPFIFLLAMPSICWLYDRFFEFSRISFIRAPVIITVFIFLFFPMPKHSIDVAKAAYNGVDPCRNGDGLMEKEYVVAQKLRGFEGIREITIALGDAGTIPYFTEANIIDLVGLNDKYIARESDISKLTHYFFSKRADLIVWGTERDFTLITHAQGTMVGDFVSWYQHPGWKEYRYSGTVETNINIYDIQFFIRKDFERYDELDAFIKRYVADKVYDNFPLPGLPPKT